MICEKIKNNLTIFYLIVILSSPVCNNRWEEWSFLKPIWFEVVLDLRKLFEVGMLGNKQRVIVEVGCLEGFSVFQDLKKIEIS